jgi:hypothetical protein
VLAHLPEVRLALDLCPLGRSERLGSGDPHLPQELVEGDEGRLASRLAGRLANHLAEGGPGNGESGQAEEKD